MNSPQQPETQGFRLLHELAARGKRIFTMLDVQEVAKKQKLSPLQLRKVLYNLTKRGWLVRLRRGLYVSSGLPHEQTTVHPFIISSHLIQPSAISHWSALQHHGLTEQIPQRITASTPNKFVTPSMRETKSHERKEKHRWEIAGLSYEYICVQQKHFFGIEKIWIEEHSQVSITDKERTLLDVFIYPKMFGGFGEALGILEIALPTINVKKLIDYAVQYNKKSLIKRLGWGLSYFGISDKVLLPLLKVPLSYFCRLDQSKPTQGPCDKHWMIQDNLRAHYKEK